MKFLKAFVGAASVVGALAVASMTALAGTGTTTESLTIPVSVTISGLAASYSATGPGGSATVIPNTFSVATNNSTGFTLTAQANTANFTAGSASFPIADDMVSAVCPEGICATSPGTALSLTAFQLDKTSGAAASDAFTINHSITPPATQAPGTYTVGVTYTATANP